MSYEGLLFSFNDTLSELTRVIKCTESFLAAGHDGRIKNWKTMLESFRRDPQSGELRWEIPTNEPIRTKPSNGRYEADGREGEYCVVGELSTIWEIKHIGKSKYVDRNDSAFCLIGNASTLARVIDVNTQKVLSQWTFDIGVKDSPGCHFHNQFQSTETALVIPRLPTYLFVPTDVLDFLLGELFQVEWARYSIAHSWRLGWGPSQKRRLLKSLEWHYKTVQGTVSSPWITLKGGKPTKEFLLEDHT